MGEVRRKALLNDRDYMLLAQVREGGEGAREARLGGLHICAFHARRISDIPGLIGSRSVLRLEEGRGGC